ncbi:hypothetical protein SC1_00799 [Sphingopyxis sp. C-1]|nr:hypothetical protein SC1_00799 [Sphingopyxis sp. C-1]
MHILSRTGEERCHALAAPSRPHIDRRHARSLAMLPEAGLGRGAFARTRCNSGWLFRPPIRRTTSHMPV